MDSTIEWTLRALNSLKKITIYLVDEFGEASAKKWLNSLEAKVDRLIEQPLSGMELRRSRGNRRLKIDKHNYLIYKPTIKMIIIRDILPYKRLKTSF